MLIDVWVFGPERGCLMRVIPVVQEIKRSRNDIEFRFFVHHNHTEIIEKLLVGNNSEVVSYGNGLQFVYDRNFDLRVLKTLVNISIYATAGFFKHLMLFRKNILKNRPVLVINDFLPFTPLYAIFYGIPVVGLYNYALRETSLGKSVLRKILGFGTRLAYHVMYGLHTKLLLEQLNPEPGSLQWETIPVISRKPTLSKKDIRSSLGISSGERLVFLSLGGGGATSPIEFLERFSDAINIPETRFLVSPRSQKEQIQIGMKFPNLFLWDPGDYNTQNLIAASDLIIARAGFTTVAEAVEHNVPVLIWSMTVHPEIRETENELQALGAAAGVLYESDSPDLIRSKIVQGLDNKTAKEALLKLPSGGTEIAASKIIDLLFIKERSAS